MRTRRSVNRPSFTCRALERASAGRRDLCSVTCRDSIQTRTKRRVVQAVQCSAKTRRPVTPRSLSSRTMASVLVPVLYIGIVITSLLIFSHFYRKRSAGNPHLASQAALIPTTIYQANYTHRISRRIPSATSMSRCSSRTTLRCTRRFSSRPSSGVR